MPCGLLAANLACLASGKVELSRDTQGYLTQIFMTEQTGGKSICSGTEDIKILITLKVITRIIISIY